MDLKKLREKLEQVQERENGGRNKLIWKPEPGDTQVRIVPYCGDPEWPIVELYFYYEFKPGTILAPCSFGKADPVKEFVDTLYRTKDADDYAVAQTLRPKLRYYVPILIRGKEDEGVKYWGFASTVYNELIKTMNDPDYGDITDLEKGNDLIVTYVKAAGAESYAKTTFRMKPKSSLACTTKEMEKAVKEMADIKSNWPEISYEDLTAALKKYMEQTPDESDDKEADDILGDIKIVDKDDPFKIEVTAASKPKEEKKLNTNKVSNDFDDLFDED